MVSEVELLGVDEVQYPIGGDDEVDEADNEADERRGCAAGADLAVEEELPKRT